MLLSKSHWNQPILKERKSSSSPLDVSEIQRQRFDGCHVWRLSCTQTSACTLSSDFYILVSETIKKAKSRRIDAFELWCWRRLLRVPWTARRSNQSILKEISPECSLERLILKLKLQYFGHLMRRTDSFEKTLMLERLKAGREGDDREWDG